MIRHYFQVAFRNLCRNPLYATINITGLALGMSCVLLVVLFVRTELSFDNFHSNSSRLYRITTTITDKEGIVKTVGSTGQVQGPAFREAIPEVQEFTRFWNVGGFNIIGNQKAFILQGLFADSSFLAMLDFPALYGNAGTALKQPASIVLTESTARKYFGRTDVLGEVLKIEEQGFQPLTVTAVLKDIPPNSSIRFDALLPFRFVETFFKDGFWFNQYLSTFILLQPGADPANVAKKFNAVFAGKSKEQLEDPRQTEGFPVQLKMGLQPISDMHLGTESVSNDSAVWLGSSHTANNMLIGIAAFILLMATINFVNLAIAQSLKRTREIGIRKINGGSRRQLVSQFMLEAGVLCLAAFLLSIAVSFLLLPTFNILTNRQIRFDLLNETSTLIVLAGVVVTSTILTGLYPAWVVSRVNAVAVLYNRQKLSSRGWVGKSLVIFQFTLAIGLIIASLVYNRQMNFMLNKDLGYTPQGLIQVSLPPQRDPDKLVNMFRNELVSEPSVLSVSGSNSWGTGNPVRFGDREIATVKLRTDEQFIPVMGIQLTAGRNFSSSMGADSLQSIIVNETFVKQAGWEHAIGQQVKTTDWEGELNRTVIGVIKDYHYSSMREKIGPQVLVMKHYGNLVVKTQPGQSVRALGRLEKLYKSKLPDSPFQFSFLDEEIRNQYQQEKLWQRIIEYATLLAIVISCLGLFGLSLFAARLRIREIGIRKVLGATEMNIVGILSFDFLKPVGLALLMTMPLSWLLMSKWLENFAYRITISWWIYFSAALISLAIALFTIGYQAIRAALANPVDSLRSE